MEISTGPGEASERAVAESGKPLSPELSSATVLDPEGAVVSLGSLLAEQPTVVLFLRHFG